MSSLHRQTGGQREEKPSPIRDQKLHCGHLVFRGEEALGKRNVWGKDGKEGGKGREREGEGGSEEERDR